MDFSEQIKAGMEWLDENRPGWDAEIHLPDLEMENTSCCVLGQTGGYIEAVSHRNSEWVSSKGFMVDDIVFWAATDSDARQSLYNDLTSQWRDAIQARQDTYDGINQAVSN